MTQQNGFLDTSGYTTAPRIQAIVAAGWTKILRSIGGTQPLTPAERQIITENGATCIGCYQMFPSSYTAAGGTRDGTNALSQASAAGMQPGDVLGVDLEGKSGEDYYGYLDNWLAVTWPAKLYALKAYLGVNAAQALTASQLNALTEKYPGLEFWTPYPSLVLSGQLPTPAQGYWASQYLDNVIIGSGAGAQAYDLNCYGLYGAPTAHPGHDIQNHPAAATSDTFTFAFRDGESVGDRHARCWEEALAGGPMGHSVRPAWYASFVNATTPAGYIGSQPVQDISSWATSCLITQEASLHHCGWPNPPHGPPKMGSGFYEVLGFASPPKFVENKGGAKPERGDILYWASTGTNGHVECLLGIDADGTWRTAGGGGGTDGTECSLRTHMNGADKYGRPLQGWWKVTEQGLPPSPR